MGKSKQEVVLERDNLGWGYHTKVTRISLCRVKTPLIRGQNVWERTLKPPS